MNERRTTTRARQLKAGSIIFNGAKCVFTCTVRNVSNAGACLLVPSLGVPAAFDLLVDGVSRRCAVAWRQPDRIGVQYQ
jgi:hypothetical protein